VLQPEWFGLADKAEAVRFAFLTVAAWWAVFTVPLVLYVRSPERTSREAGPGWRHAWQELLISWRLLRSLPNAFVFLIAYWFYIDGVDTIVRMAVDYGLSIGFAADGLLTALLVTQFVGFPAALFFGRIGDRIGARGAIFLALAVYVIVVIWSARITEVWEFYGLAVMIGLVQGGVQAMSRALFARLIPAEHAGRLFGLYNMMGKFAAILGPVLVGWVAVVTDSSRVGILSILVLFLVGAILLSRVDVRQGEADAGRLAG
jgi:UMF1 family MFS transporter